MLELLSVELGRAAELDLPVGDQRDPITQSPRFLHVLRGDDDDTVLFIPADDISDEALGGLVHALRGIIKQDNVRVAEHAQRKSQHLSVLQAQFDAADLRD